MLGLLVCAPSLFQRFSTWRSTLQLRHRQKLMHKFNLVEKPPPTSVPAISTAVIPIDSTPSLSYADLLQQLHTQQQLVAQLTTDLQLARKGGRLDTITFNSNII